MISPWAPANHVDHHLSDQASIINFVEYNWHLPGISGSADQVLSHTDRSQHIPFDLAGLFSFGHCCNAGVKLSPATGLVVGR